MQARIGPETEHVQGTRLAFEFGEELPEQALPLSLGQVVGEIDVTRRHERDETERFAAGFAQPDGLRGQMRRPGFAGSWRRRPGGALRLGKLARTSPDGGMENFAQRDEIGRGRLPDLDMARHAGHRSLETSASLRGNPFMSTAHRPRRSCLYMPGANARALEKAREILADTLILDLEDAVAPEAKAEARAAIAAALNAGGYGPRELVVRMNGLDTEWGHADLEMAVAAGAHAVLAPKVTSARDIERLDAALKSAGAAEGFALWVMIEMPLAILNIHEIAAAATRSHLTTFVMGTNDLAKEYRARMTPDRLAFQTALQLSMAAARAYGLTAIDGVYNDIKNEEGFAAECEQGRDLGFDGKTLIHPSQVETCNRTFAPSAADVNQARAVIAAFADPVNAGKGVLKVNGKMTELLHLDEARRTVAMDEAIRAFA